MRKWRRTPSTAFWKPMASRRWWWARRRFQYSHFKLRCPDRCFRTPSGCWTKPRLPALTRPWRLKKAPRKRTAKVGLLGFDLEAASIGPDSNCTHLIGPEYLDFCRPQPVQNIGVRMPIKVFETG